MNQTTEHVGPESNGSASVIRDSRILEGVNASGNYGATCYAPVAHLRAEYDQMRRERLKLQAELDALPKLARAVLLPLVLSLKHQIKKLSDALAAIPLELKWADEIQNVVTTEGKNALLTNHLKASAFTQTAFLGIIESAGYGFAGAQGSGVAATNLASSITAAAGASPANGWNEATSAKIAARGTPTFGTASAGSLATSSAVSFSVAADHTAKGCFLMVKSAAGVAAVSTVGSTAGALYSAGLFTGGDKVLQASDTLNVTYTATA